MSVQRFEIAEDENAAGEPCMFPADEGEWMRYVDHCHKVFSLNSSLAEREQWINRLRELATDWIRDETHKRNCDHWYAVPGCVPSCSCGLSSLRAALAATEGEKR